MAGDALHVHEVIGRPQISHQFGVNPSVTNQDKLWFRNARSFIPIPPRAIWFDITPSGHDMPKLTLQGRLDLVRFMRTEKGFEAVITSLDRKSVV